MIVIDPLTGHVPVRERAAGSSEPVCSDKQIRCDCGRFMKRTQEDDSFLYTHICTGCGETYHPRDDELEM